MFGMSSRRSRFGTSSYNPMHSTPSMKGVMSRMRGDMIDPRTKHLPSQTVSQFSSDLFLWGAGASILLSLGLRLMGRRDDALFVGEWPATLAVLGVMTRMLGR